MDLSEIAFDPLKETANLAKHEMSLAWAADILADPGLVKRVDRRQDYGEERIVAYGSVDGRVFAVVYTLREQSIRVISVRRANARERTYYDQGQAIA